MSKQDLLLSLLRKKGIGKTMSKSLLESDCSDVFKLMTDDDCSLTTKATLLSALLCLDQNEFEKKLLFDLSTISNLDSYLYSLLRIEPTHSTLFNYALELIRGHHLSYEHARHAFDLILDPKEKEHEKSVFF